MLSVELTEDEASFVLRMLSVVQIQGRENVLVAAGLFQKIEAAAGPPLDSVEREIARAEASF